MICRLFLMFLIISFGGWAFEKIGGLLLYGNVGDRGFLTLPLCPIYGTTVLGIYFLMGTPKAPRGVGACFFGEYEEQKTGQRIIKYIVYFAAATILPTLAEFLVGGAFKLMGMPLWDYSEKPFNLFGVICLYYSFLWGVLITLLMDFLWDRLYRLTERLSQTLLLGISFSAGIVILGDFFATTAATVNRFLSSR